MDNKSNENERKEKQGNEVSKTQESNDQSSYNEYIRGKIKEKASKFHEELMSLEHKAVDFLKNLYSVIQKNHHIREYLKSVKNYYMNYFFNYFGYRYESIIESPNFFHFISQAWLVNAFEQIKETSNLDNENYTSIIEKLFEVDVNKKKLISSLELITETIYVSDPTIKITELTLGKNFLKHIKQVLKEKKNQFSKTILTKEEFGMIIMEILRKTVNLTINEIDSFDADNKNLIFYETYQEMISLNESPTLEEFTSKVEEKSNGKNEANKLDITMTNACEAFYFFSQSSFSTLIVDLEMFNLQYTSFISKIRIILNKKGHSLKEFMFKIYKDLEQIYSNVKDNIKFKKLFEFYKISNEKLKIFKDNSREMVVTKYNNYRDWVYNSKIKNTFMYPGFIFEKVNELSSNSRVFLYDKIYQPSKNITFSASAYSYNLIINNVENVKESSLTVYSSIKENTLKLLNSKLKIKEDYIDKFIKIHVDEEKNLIIIEISKKLFAINSDKFTTFISKTLEILKNLKLKENIQQIYEKSKETSLHLKDKAIEKYKKFVTFFDKNSQTS